MLPLRGAELHRMTSFSPVFISCNLLPSCWGLCLDPVSMFLLFWNHVWSSCSVQPVLKVWKQSWMSKAHKIRSHKLGLKDLLIKAVFIIVELQAASEPASRFSSGMVRAEFLKRSCALNLQLSLVLSSGNISWPLRFFRSGSLKPWGGIITLDGRLDALSGRDFIVLLFSFPEQNEPESPGTQGAVRAEPGSGYRARPRFGPALAPAQNYWARYYFRVWTNRLLLEWSCLGFRNISPVWDLRTFWELGVTPQESHRPKSTVSQKQKIWTSSATVQFYQSYFILRIMF